MKRIFRTMLMTFLAFSTVSLMSCGDDKDDNNPENPENPPAGFTLAKTSWLGQYTGSVQGAPAVLTWTLDFDDETNGAFTVELDVNGQGYQPQTISFTYTFDAESNEGIIRPSQGGQMPFTRDATSNTLTMSLAIRVGEETLGGQTVFSQI